MRGRDLMWILVIASIGVTIVSLLLGTFFLFLFFPLVFPLAFARRFRASRQHAYRRPPEQDAYTKQEPREERDWREKWK